MRNIKNFRLISMLGLAVILVILLASGIEDIQLKPARIYDFQTNLNAWFILFSTVIFASIVFLLLFRPKIKRSPKPAPKTSLLSIFLQLLLWFIVLYLLRERLPILAPLQQALTSDNPAADMTAIDLPMKGFVSYSPEWLLYLLSGAGIIAGVLLIRYFYKNYVETRFKYHELIEQAQTALNEIRSGSEINNTIIRCYANMCKLLDHEKGIRRHVSMTSREFEQNLVKIGIPEAPIRELTRLFEKVRYGSQLDTQLERESAISCMEAIIHSSRTQLPDKSMDL
jgi:hypothetical protein